MHTPHGSSPTAQPPHHGGNIARRWWWINYICAAIIFVSLLLIAGQLPIDKAVRGFSAYVGELGLWGPVLYGLAYIAAAVLLVPGSVMTIGAGAIFGLLWGTITASLAATAGAAAAFLIARYLARHIVERGARRYPRFGAIDRAIARGGWRIIALLRLSPAVPYNIGNYLFGLTAIRFWPYVLTSWIAMLPSTFMWAYVGYLGRAGLAAGAGEKIGRRRWAMLIVGLIATVIATVYITRLTRRAIHEARIPGEADIAPIEDESHDITDTHRPPLRSVALIVAAAIAITLAVLSIMHSERLANLLR